VTTQRRVFKFEGEAKGGVAYVYAREGSDVRTLIMSAGEEARTVENALNMGFRLGSERVAPSDNTIEACAKALFERSLREALAEIPAFDTPEKVDAAITLTGDKAKWACQTTQRQEIFRSMARLVLDTAANASTGARIVADALKGSDL